MAESSLFYNITISDSKQCYQLLRAIERSNNTKSNVSVEYENVKGVKVKDLFK